MVLCEMYHARQSPRPVESHSISLPGRSVIGRSLQNYPRDSFVRTDQSQTSLAGKYCEIRPMKDDFYKDFIRTGRGD